MEHSAFHAIEELLQPSLEAMGFDLVRVMIAGQNDPTLQIMVERKDRSSMTVEHCAEVSETVSALLDVADPIQGTYRLEVSSPGLDRPLTRLEHFERFQGFTARIELNTPLAGRKRFKGKLLGVEADTVAIDTETGPERLPMADVRKAKLVIDDELLAAARLWAETGRSP